MGDTHSADPRNRGMRRIVVVGNSGSGKTTLARELAARLQLTHIELDALFHQPNWTPRDPDEFATDLRQRLEAAIGGWTVCGNYRSVTWPITVPAADTVVWLDLPRSLVMKRVVSRTLRRSLTREELWNGNREPLTNLYRWDPEKNIMRWSWTMHESYRRRYETAVSDGSWDHAVVHRLRSRAEVDDFLARSA